jgi:Xaa-Pro aminopeptidase
MHGPLFDPQRVADTLDRHDIAALVATTAPNVQYLTKYRRGNTVALLTRGALDRPVLFVPANNIAYTLEDPLEGLEVRPYGFFVRYFADQLTEREERMRRMHEAIRRDASAWELLAESLTEAGLASATVATDGLVESLAPLAERLPTLRVTSRGDIYRHLRMVKTAEEIARLAEAARITEHAIVRSAQSAFLGCTQQHLARVYNHVVVEANATTRQDNASIDRGGAFGNLNTPGDVVEDGSIIRYDVGVHYRGYASDIARCFAFRRIPDRARRIQDALVAGLERALELVRPGAIAEDIFQAAVAATRQAGLPEYDRSHVGHGIGTAGAGYEAPDLKPGDRTALEPGTILCVETPYSEVGYGGLQVEDMLVVTETGYDLLSHTPRGIQLVPS